MASEFVKIIAKCWLDAEQELRNILFQRYWDVDEEFITTALRGELRCAFARESPKFEDALRRELELKYCPPGPIEIPPEDWLRRDPEQRSKTFPSGQVSNNNPEIDNAVSGLKPVVTFHSKHLEGETGGDLGIILCLPKFDIGSDNVVSLGSKPERHGLLVQAKLEKLVEGKTKWGKLTDLQEKNLENRLKYVALLLYRYEDAKSERQKLCPFKWIMCKDDNIEKIKQWLRDPDLAQLPESEEVILGLAEGKYGTSSSEEIDQHIWPLAKRGILKVSFLFKNPRPSFNATIECQGLQDREAGMVRER